ncbi:hypothetical protein HDU88_002361 [Geranomyces variabilis]|nr:hypothetical protein HDU88_002361 [Geranomyces variabilis]
MLDCEPPEPEQDDSHYDRGLKRYVMERIKKNSFDVVLFAKKGNFKFGEEEPQPLADCNVSAPNLVLRLCGFGPLAPKLDPARISLVVVVQSLVEKIDRLRMRQASERRRDVRLHRRNGAQTQSVLQVFKETDDDVIKWYSK